MKKYCCIIACLLSVFASRAHGDLIYAFDQSNYQVAVNGTIDVQVFLQQFGSIAGDPADLSTDGLTSGSVQLFFNDTPPSDPAEVLMTSDILPNPALDDTLLGAEFDLNPGVSAAFVDGVDFTPLLGTNILLGTFTFTAGSVAGEVTNLRTSDWRAFDDTVAGNFAALDGVIGNTTATITTFSSAAVPEPSSFVPLLLLAMVGVRRIRYRTSGSNARQS